MKKIISIAIIAAFAIPFSGCKKGEGDPFLSLSSRKARIAGSWTLKKYDETTVTINKTPNPDVTINTTYSYDGTTMTETINSGAGNNTIKYAYSTTYKFEKDGTWTGNITSSEYNPATNRDYEGTWNFTSSVGKDRKNKDRIIMIITKITSQSPTGTPYVETFTGPNMFWEYDIYQLKKKEIVLKKKNTSDDPSFNTTQDATWTYEVK